MLSAKVRTYNLARLQNNHFVGVNFDWLLVFFSWSVWSVSVCFRKVWFLLSSTLRSTVWSEKPRIQGLQNMFGILVMVSQSFACIYVYICFYIHIYVNIHIQNLYCDININICRCVCMYIQYAEYGPAVFVHAWCFSIISLYMGLFFAWVFSMESVCWLSIQCYTVLLNHSKQIKTQKYIKQKNTQTSLCKIDRWKTMKPHSKHRF